MVGWGHVIGCGGMWQGVGECGSSGGRVWVHVAGGGVCGRGSGLCHGWGYVAYPATCPHTLPHIPIYAVG